MSDHIHMLISIPPKYSVAQVVASFDPVSDLINSSVKPADMVSSGAIDMAQ